MNHPHSVMNFPSLSGSPTGQPLSGHFANVFSDCPPEPPLDLNFVQKLSQGGQKAANDFEMIAYQPQQNETSPMSQMEIIPKATAEQTPLNCAQDTKMVLIAEAAPKPAQRSRCHWSHGEVMALFDAKKAEADRFDAEMPGKKIKYSQERWDEIAEFVKSRGCTKLASQCKDKWEKIWPAFRKIYDWEKQIPPGKASFWTMLGDEREQEGFPRGFDKELYDAMAARFGNIKPTDLSSIVVDSSNDEAVDATMTLTNELAHDGIAVFEDCPSVVDEQTPVSSGRKRKSPPNTKQTSDKNGKLLKDPQIQAKAAELAERKLSLEERKVRLAEKRFHLEEKKLEATIEIGKGLIASMERMTQTISSMGAFTGNNS